MVSVLLYYIYLLRIPGLFGTGNCCSQLPLDKNLMDCLNFILLNLSRALEPRQQLVFDYNYHVKNFCFYLGNFFLFCISK